MKGMGQKGMGQPLSHGVRGTYAECRLRERLRLAHLIDFVPGSEPYESLIEVGFSAAGDHARMVVTLHPHLDPHWTKMSVEGFSSQLNEARQAVRLGGAPKLVWMSGEAKLRAA